MAGGPGEAAPELADLVIGWGDTDEHDVVLVDERGTGDGHGWTANHLSRTIIWNADFERSV